MVNKIIKKINDNIDILKEEVDIELIDILITEYKELECDVEKLRIETYLSHEYDKNNCILEIHSGAGGTESCDWVAMLYRMYTRYLVKNGYSYQEIDKQEGEEVGLKSVMILIKGRCAYGYFKGETGVHRLVRISPFDANKRRHTTFASVLVTPEFDNNISVDINDSDLRVDIYRIVVTCQNERSQIRNKQIAMEVLKNKLYALELDKKNNELNGLKGEQMSIGFGSGKRSYVMCPYTLVKDNESGYETANVLKILDGEIGEMLEWNIRRQ